MSNEERKVIEDRGEERTLREVIAKVEEALPEALDNHAYLLLTIDQDDETTGVCAIGAKGKESIKMVASMINQVSLAERNPYIPEYYIEALQEVERSVVAKLAMDIMAKQEDNDESEN